MAEFWDKNVVPMYDAATGKPVTVRLSDGATVDQFQLPVCGGVKGDLIIGCNVTFNQAAYNEITIQNGELSLSAAEDVGTLHVQIAGPLADEENYNSSFTLNSGAVTEVQNRNGGQFVMKGGSVSTLTTEQFEGARHPQIISVSGGSIGSASIQTGSDVTVSGGSIDSLTYVSSGYVTPYEPGRTKISGGSFGTITLPEGEAVSQLLAEGYAFYNQADNTPADVTGSTVSNVFAAKAETHIIGDLDFLEEEIKPGTLETDGFSWEYTPNSAGENQILTLNLKDCTIPGNIVLPDNMESITIHLEGDNSVGGFVSTKSSKYQDYYYDPNYPYHITVTGSGTLEIGGQLGNSSGDGSTLLIDSGAAVTVKDGAAANGTVTVRGDLTAAGGYAAVNTGKLHIEGGSLTVSGQKGVMISGVYTGSGRDFTQALVMTEGSTFTGDCADFNIWVYDSYNSIPDDADISTLVSVPEGYIADGYAVRSVKSDGQFGLSIVPQETPDPSVLSGTGMGGHLELKVQPRKITVSLTSTLNGKADAAVANLMGGGQYITGDTVTVTAHAADGCTFEGWYNGSNLESPNLIYTFTAADPVELAAKYKSNAKVTVTINGLNDAWFYVNDNTTSQTACTENDVLIGSKIRLTAVEPERVSAWLNGSDKVIGTGESIEITVTGEMIIKLMYKANTDNKAMVEYISDYGQLLSYKYYSESDTIEPPVAPSKLGYTFTGWNRTEAEIQQLIATGEKHIIVRPVYEASGADCTVTVEYPAGTLSNDTYTGKQGSGMTVPAKMIEGKVFSHWSSDQEGNHILSYEQSYFIQLTSNITLYAIYADEAVEAKPIIAITSKYASAVEVTSKIYEQQRNLLY